MYRPGDEIWRIKRKIGPYCNDNIGIARIRIPVETKRFFEYPFNSVPDYRSFYLPADADADSIVGQVIGEIDQAETFAVQPTAVSVNRREFLVFT